MDTSQNLKLLNMAKRNVTLSVILVILAVVKISLPLLVPANSDNYLYDYSTWEAIGVFDYERNIFISTRGEYLGEIIYDNVLIKNTQSEYVNVEFDIQPTIPTAPVPKTAPTRATVPTLPSWYQDLK